MRSLRSSILRGQARGIAARSVNSMGYDYVTAACSHFIRWNDLI